MKVSQVTQVFAVPAYSAYQQNQTFEGRLIPGSAKKARIIQTEFSKKGITSNFEKTVI